MDSSTGSDLIVTLAWRSAEIAALGAAALMLMALLVRRYLQWENGRHARVIAAWRAPLARIAIEGDEPPLPPLPHGHVPYVMEEWNALQEAVRGESSERLNAVARKLGLDVAARRFMHSGRIGRRILAIRTLGHLRDPASWKPLQDQLASRAGRMPVDEKMQALLNMAGGVGHVFNNVLAGILGRTQLLVKRASREKSREIASGLHEIESATRTGIDALARIQEFSRSRPAEPFAPVDLNDIVQRAVEQTRARWRDEPTARGAPIELITHFGPHAQLIGAESELLEAVVQLLYNAVDAMPRGGTITIRTGLDDNGDTVFTDRPDGIGRNTERGTWVRTLNLRLGWRPEFGASDATDGADGPRSSHRGVEFYAQAWNILNETNFTRFSGVMTSPYYLQPTAAAPARRFDFGTRVFF